MSSLSLASYRKQDQNNSSMGKGPVSLLSKHAPPDVDEILQNCIDAIWNKYDTDDTGYLDREECFAVIMESVQEFPADPLSDDGDEENEEDLMEKYKE